MVLALASVEYFPFQKTWPIVEVWAHLLRHIHKVDIFTHLLESGLHDGFVFDWIEGAGRVDESAILFQQLQSSQQDIKLQLMVLMAHMAVEVLPQAQILS